ncbi:MAG: FAD-binding oxidoreductase [Myxococcota bacterium]
MTRLPQAELIAGLADIVGAGRVSTELTDLLAYSGDFWPKLQIWKMGQDVERYPPDCVVWPETEGEVAGVLRFCADQHIPVVPYGGGSGVCGGTLPVHGGVVVDLKRMRRVTHVDEASLTVTAEGGILGSHLEERLNAAGTTLGHFPSSIMCSTLGGWLATRSGGQFSSRYGKIEDMVLSLRVVLPDGSILDTADRDQGEPDWTQLVVGTEGTLGLITSATMKVHALPEARHLRGYKFHHMRDAMKGMRMVMQAGLRPMVLRLYDPFDSMIALGKEGGGPDPDEEEAKLGMFKRAGEWLTGHPVSLPGEEFTRKAGREIGRKALAAALSLPTMVNAVAHAVPSPCLLIIGFEGPEESVQRQAWRARQLLAEEGGVDAGAGPGEAWLDKRYKVSFKASRIYQAGGFVDTMEVATTWDRLETLFEAVRRAVSPYAFVMAHFSHAYRDGCSIYFTFAGFRRQPQRAEALYDRIWRTALEAAQRAGGVASHHHGVGLLKKHAMVDEHGEMLRVWRAMKEVVDPDGIMNPGKLFPDGAGVP